MRSTASILLPTDFERPARRAFAYGLNFAGVLGARVRIFHVIKTPSDLSDPPSPVSRYLKSLKTSALLQLGRLARLAMEAGVSAEPQLGFGAPDACILEAVEKTQPRMIVMGTEGREGWDRLRPAARRNASSGRRLAQCWPFMEDLATSCAALPESGWHGGSWPRIFPHRPTKHGEPCPVW
jgi:nucleotide-binding universal stress UspA family protein